MLTLACAALHPAIPALVPGDLLSVGGGHVTVPETPSVLRRLADAIQDRAIVFLSPPDWDEIEREVLAERDRLVARLDALVAARQARALALAS